MAQNIPPFRWRSLSCSENKVVRPTVLRALPDSTKRCFHHSLAIERYLAIAVEILRVIEVAIVEPFVYHDTVVEDIVPSKRESFAHRIEPNTASASSRSMTTSAMSSRKHTQMKSRYIGRSSSSAVLSTTSTGMYWL